MNELKSHLILRKIDYSMYTYYKGSDEYPNKKAAQFGFYEKLFENTYEGSPENKTEAFMDYIHDFLYQQASDGFHFGTPGVDKDKCFEEYYRRYKEPDYRLDIWE